jgi:hypothetical protein
MEFVAYSSAQRTSAPFVLSYNQTTRNGKTFSAETSGHQHAFHDHLGQAPLGFSYEHAFGLWPPPCQERWTYSYHD